VLFHFIASLSYWGLSDPKDFGFLTGFRYGLNFLMLYVLLLVESIQISFGKLIWVFVEVILYLLMVYLGKFCWEIDNEEELKPNK
jgi:hypothetical protein